MIEPAFAPRSSQVIRFSTAKFVLPDQVSSAFDQEEEKPDPSRMAIMLFGDSNAGDDRGRVLLDGLLGGGVEQGLLEIFLRSPS